MARRLVFLSLCAALLAGCGGSNENKVAPRGPEYVRAPTKACLERHGFTVSTTAKAVNFIAYTSVGGGLRAWKPKRHRQVDVIMAFGANGNDARQTLVAVKRFASNPPIFRFRLRKSNVVLLWAYRPPKRQAKTVYACLKTAPAAKQTTTSS